MNDHLHPVFKDICNAVQSGPIPEFQEPSWQEVEREHLMSILSDWNAVCHDCVQDRPGCPDWINEELDWAHERGYLLGRLSKANLTDGEIEWIFSREDEMAPPLVRFEVIISGAGEVDHQELRENIIRGIEEATGIMAWVEELAD